MVDCIAGLKTEPNFLMKTPSKETSLKMPFFEKKNRNSLLNRVVGVFFFNFLGLL